MAYRRVTFKSVVDGVFAMAGVVRSTAANPDALLEQVVGFVNLRIREGVEYDFWPELCPAELRRYRPFWDDTTAYDAGTELWFAGLSGVAVLGAGEDDLNGDYLAVAGTGSLTHPVYYLNGDTTAAYIQHVTLGGNWVLFKPGTGGMYSSTVAATPWAGEWSAGLGAEPPPGVLEKADAATGAGYFIPIYPAPAGYSPMNTPALWQALSDFKRYISLDQAGETPIGEVMALYQRDPTASPRTAGRLSYVMAELGVIPVGCAPDGAWVHFRIRPPAYSAANYADATPANFPVPYVIASFVQRAAFADFLFMDGKDELGGRALSRATKDLLDASDAAGASQGQYPTARVSTY